MDRSLQRPLRLDEEALRPSSAQQATKRQLVAAGSIVATILLCVLVVRACTPSSSPSSKQTNTTTTAASIDRTTTKPKESEPSYVPTGEFATASLADGPVIGAGPLHTYRVEVEANTGMTADEFARLVESTLNDPRSWSRLDGISLQRVTSGEADTMITLGTPSTVDALCAPLKTEGGASCAKVDRSIINARLFNDAASPAKLSVEDYQHYVINHEFGHVLGHHHRGCPGAGKLAPVMLQQTYGIGACLPNPWPNPDASEN